MNPLFPGASPSFPSPDADSNLPSQSLPAEVPSENWVAPSLQTRAEAFRQRLAFNQLTTLPWSLQDDLDEYRRNMVPAIGIHWRKLISCGVRRGIRRIQQSGLPVSSLSWIGGFTGENGYALPDTLSEARRIIRVASQLHASCVTVITGPQAGHIRSHAFRLAIDGIKELVEFAGIYGVTLTLQPMHAMFQKNWSFIHSLDDAMFIIDRVADPRLKLSFGTYHLWQEADLIQRLPEITPHIGLVTLADWGEAPRHENDRLLPGQGRLPIPGVIQALENNGFSGWYELEVWSRDLWKLEQRDLMRECLDAGEHLTEQVFVSESAS